MCEVADSTTRAEVVGMKRRLGLWHGVSVIMGSVIGSGIFITANSVLAHCGSIGMTLIVWTACGLLVLCGSVMYIELGTSLPLAGGDYEYLNTLLGGLMAFMYSYSRMVLVVPSTIAVAGLSFGSYLLQPFFKCGVPPAPQIMLAILSVLSFAYLNCRSVKLVTQVQLLFAACKTTALLIVIGAGFYGLATKRTNNFDKPFEGTSTTVASIISGFYGCIFTFAGWNYLNCVVEEMKQPEKVLPKAAGLALTFIAIVYLFVNIAYFALLPKSLAVSSNAIAVDALRTIWEPFGFIVSIFVSLSVFGFINSMLFTTSRIAYSAARNRHMPPILCYLNVTYSTPILSIATVTAITMIFITLGTLSSLLYMVAFTESLYFVFTCIGFFNWRLKRMEMNRPFKAPLAPTIVFTVMMVFITIVGMIQQPVECLTSLAINASGLIFYFILLVLQMPSDLNNKISELCQGIQIIVNGLPCKDITT